MNRSTIQFFFNKNIPIDISSGTHEYNLTDTFSRKCIQNCRILRDKVKIFKVFFFYPNLVVGITAINFNFHVIRNLNARLLLRYKRNFKGRRRSCRANKNDAPAALFEYYPKAPRVCT